MPESLCVLHDSRNGLLARRIAFDLFARGISARADLGEMRIGSALAPLLTRGAVTASAGLVLLTPVSVNEPWLTRDLPFELRHGLLRGWRLIVGTYGVRAVPESLAGAPVVDLADYPAALTALLALL